MTYLILYFIVGKVLPNQNSANVKARVYFGQLRFTVQITTFLRFGKYVFGVVGITYVDIVGGERRNWTNIGACCYPVGSDHMVEEKK
jgi:hypothetical protein